MRYLLIAEKPSLMKEIQSTYERHLDEVVNKVGHIDFCALAGHVCGNFTPDDYPEWGSSVKWEEIEYPMVPKEWKIKAINDPSKLKIIDKIKKSVSQYDGIIVATDSDTEGYLIYYNLEQFLGIQNKFALRFIEHDLTDPAILESLLTMTDYHTDPKHIYFVLSAILRSRTDWLYGMNATRIMTIKNYGNMLTIGRVKAPTIKLVYDNSMAITNFVPEQYYEVLANYGTFKSTLLTDDEKVAKFKSENEIPNIPPTGIVKSYTKKKAKSHAPQLFDLSSLQVECGKEFGFSPAETLDYLESLYLKKLVSYPRTQCRYCSTEKAKDFPIYLSNMNIFEDLIPFANTITNEDIARLSTDKKVVNDNEVNKESHDALLPTSLRPDLSKLEEEEIDVLKMIYSRVLANMMPEAIDDKVTAIIEHGTFKFRATGKTIINDSWRAITKSDKDEKDKKEEDNYVLPELTEGMVLNANEMEHKEKTTTPPKRLTQATLLAAMENIASILEDEDLKKSLAESKGIGTPATRSTIIKDIIDRGYVDEKRGALYITNNGINYVESIEETSIISPVFAAILDTQIKKIQRGETTFEAEYNDVLNQLYSMCNQMIEMQIKVPVTSIVCARCNNFLINERFNYRCPCCNYKIPKELCKVKISEDDVQLMMKGSQTQLKTFTKKDGKTFNARLRFNFEKNETEFSFSSGLYCPYCQHEIIENKAGYFCNEDRGGCGFKFFASNFFNKKIAENDVIQLFTTGNTRTISGFKTKEGKEFAAKLYFGEDGQVKLDFAKKRKAN